MTVTVSPDGEVRLAEDRKPKARPRGLHSNVLTAANAATIETLEQFSARLSSAGTGVVSAESSGGHVRAPRAAATSAWTSTRPGHRSPATPRSRASCSASAPSDFAPQPQGPACTELMGLLADPALLLRRVGLTPPAEADHASRLGKLDGHRGDDHD